MEPVGLTIGKKKVRIPIIQGGMGIGVSRSGLAGAVAKNGGVGVIASVALGLISPYFKKKSDYYEANKLSLRDEIKKAREIAGSGVIGVNCMVAITDYEQMVKVSVENGADLIISGAGLPTSLPGLTKEYPDVALVPIVSSVKAASVIIRKWEKSYGRIPDAIIYEHPRYAGGHLGASYQELEDPKYEFPTVIPDLVEAVKPFGGIPIIAAGGIWDAKDIRNVMSLGASGVQMASRFVCTHECDADIKFKEIYISAGDEDLAIVHSPVGLPGRAINTAFMKSGKKAKGKGCMANCLKVCAKRDMGEEFCIALALKKAVTGDIKNGLFFAGTNAPKSSKLVSVADLMKELAEGFVPAPISIPA
ncbi:MAG TPA: nitronate monooxygenase family protein [Thermodesulfobacteriota bacterium]|nr:nitronate monooxygenase family protein [Thermodesulfobacteriota bacterium]